MPGTDGFTHTHSDIETKLAHTWRYRPFVPLQNEASAANGFPGELRVAAASQLLQDGEQSAALEATGSLIQDTLQGLRYLDT
jgi:hypothetical protein